MGALEVLETNSTAEAFLSLSCHIFGLEEGQITSFLDTAHQSTTEDPLIGTW